MITSNFLNYLAQYKITQNKAYGINPVTQEVLDIVEDLQQREVGKMRYDYILGGIKTAMRLVQLTQQKIMELNEEFQTATKQRRKEIVAECIELKDQLFDLVGE